MNFFNLLFAVAYLSIVVQTATVNVYPSIVQLIAESSPSQTFKNTAGSTNEFYVAAISANEGRGPVENWIFNNRVFTIVGFEDIPPFADNCELRVSLPPEQLLWQTAISLTGGISTPTLFVLPVHLSLSLSSTWTWNAFVAAEPSDAAVQYPVLNGADFTDGSIEVIVPMESCPGVVGPTGGAIGYAFAIANDIPWSSASMFMNMDYSGPDVFGVYLQYTT